MADALAMPKQNTDEASDLLSHEEAHEHFTVLQRKEVSAKQVHAALRLEGDEELNRSTVSLLTSAIACGITLGLSLMSRGVLQHHLPDAPWRPLIASLGYAAGFIAVELGRQELYTGNTLTAILPFLQHHKASVLRNVLRVWVAVLVGNLAGAAVFAWAASWTSTFEAPLRATFGELGRHAASHGVGSAFVKGVFGGWLIALMIWLMPGAHYARIWVIALVAWVLAATELTHIVAGSIEVLFAVFSGVVSLRTYVGHYFIPVLLGNTLGSLIFVGLLNHIQVASDDAKART